MTACPPVTTSALAPLLGAQHKRILTLSFPGKDGPDAQLLANQLSATERMSRDFEFVVEVLSDNARLELKDLIGKRVTVSLVREDGSLRHFNGHVFEFSLERVDGAVSVPRLARGERDGDAGGDAAAREAEDARHAERAFRRAREAQRRLDAVPAPAL